MNSQKKHRESENRKARRAYYASDYVPRYSLDTHDPFEHLEALRAIEDFGGIADLLDHQHPNGKPVLAEDV